MAGGAGTSTSTADVYLIRTNTFGDTLWTRTYDRSQTDVALDVKQTTDSGFIVASIVYDTTVYKNNIYLIKTDAVGDTLWTHQYFSPVHQVVHSVEQTAEGGYILCGVVPAGLYLLKTDLNGDSLWSRTFNASTACTGYFVRQTTDGGYIICGVSNMPPTGFYIIKTDSLGNVASSTGVAELNNPFVFNIYPNPSAGIFNVAVKGFPKTTAAIEVYNFTNECVYTCSINNNTTEQLNLSHLPNGIYAVRLRTKNKVAAQKIIIQK